MAAPLPNFRREILDAYLLLETMPQIAERLRIKFGFVLATIRGQTTGSQRRDIKRQRATCVERERYRRANGVKPENYRTPRISVGPYPSIHRAALAIGISAEMGHRLYRRGIPVERWLQEWKLICKSKKSTP